MLGVDFKELFPCFPNEKIEEVVKINDAEIKLNDRKTIEEYKKIIDEINSLT